MNIRTHNYKNADLYIKKEIIDSFEDNLKSIDEESSLKDIKLSIRDLCENLGFINRYKLFYGTNMQIFSYSEEKSLAVCNQTGHFGLSYYDLCKLESLYIRKLINAAIYICPTKQSKYVKSNATTTDKLQEDLTYFKEIFNVPIYFIGLNNESKTNIQFNENNIPNSVRYGESRHDRLNTLKRAKPVASFEVTPEAFLKPLM